MEWMMIIPMRSHIDHERAMLLYRRGLSDQQIARVLEVGNSSVARWRWANDLPTNNPIPKRGGPVSVWTCLPKQQAERVLKCLFLFDRAARQQGSGINILDTLRGIGEAV
jgi:hypothetical protein